MPALRRVALDALPLQVRSAGVATYTRELVRALATLQPAVEFVLFGLPPPFGAAPDLRGWPANVRLQRAWTYPFVVGEPGGGRIPRLLPLEHALAGVDCFHATAYAAPRARRVPVVLTVHDLALLRAPALGTPALRRTVRGVAAAAQRAARVIADSAHTRDALVADCGLAPERIAVVALGVDAAFRPLAPDAARAAVAARLGLTAPYLLHVGTLEPRKNLPALVRAWNTLRRQRAAAPQLVLAGAPGWGAAAVEEAIAACGAADDVRLTGRVADDLLPALYAGAEAVVVPSLEEGFGLPVVEAMACGTPVVATRAGALPEVAGDAALLVEPGDEAALAAALVRVSDDELLRAQLRAAGLARAAAFTWEACARATWRVYEEAVG